MQNRIDEKEFEVKKKWQDFNKYYIAIYASVVLFVILLSFINSFLFDLPHWVVEVVIPLYLFLLPLAFCLLMFRRTKNAPILNTMLIAKSIAVLITSFYTALLTLLAVLSLKSYYIDLSSLGDLVESALKIIGIYCIIEVIAFCTLLPISSLYNKYFPRS